MEAINNYYPNINDKPKLAEIPEHKQSWYCNRCNTINYSRKSIYPHCGNGCGNSKKFAIKKSFNISFLCPYCHIINDIDILSNKNGFRCEKCNKIPPI